MRDGRADAAAAPSRPCQPCPVAAARCRAYHANLRDPARVLPGCCRGATGASCQSMAGTYARAIDRRGRLRHHPPCHREADPAPPPPRCGIAMTDRAALDPTSGATAPLTSVAARSMPASGPSRPPPACVPDRMELRQGCLHPPRVKAPGVAGPRSSSRCGMRDGFGPGLFAPLSEPANPAFRHRSTGAAANCRASGAYARASHRSHHPGR